MSLQVWLPLNGNTKQQGTSDIIMSGSPNSWGNAGKIGQCATFAGNVGNDIYNNTTAFNYVDNFSWCIWVNTKYTGTASQYVFTVGRADAGGYGYGLQCNNTSTCSCRYGNKIYSVSVTDGTWTHLAFTKSGTTINLYKNGVLYSTNTFNGTAPTYSDGNGLGIGCFHYSGKIYPFWGSVNDFRIYDHCLSPKEVHEIAQGLVLHYPLNNIGGRDGNENLKPYTHWYSANRPGSVGGTFDRTSVEDPEAGNGKHIEIKCVSAGTGFYFGGIGKTTETIGKTYTWSFWGKCSVNKTGQVGDETGGYTQISLTTEWKKFSRTWTVGNTTYQAFTFYLGWNVGDVLYIRDFKFEEGSVATPWCPNVADPEYAALGYNSNVVSDCSGYGNDGTIYGTLSLDSNSSVYDNCTQFNGSSYIQSTTNGLIPDSTNFSISCWIKSTAALGNWYRIGGLGEHTYIQLDIDTTGKPRVFIAQNGSTAVLNTAMGDTNILDGNWHHICGIGTPTLLTIYVDGIQKASSSRTIIQSKTNAIAYVGTVKNGALLPGSISDFRIYSTALSAEDVKALYQQGASIDNLGSMHTYGEFNEGQEKISIGKNKVVSEGSVNEEGNKTSFHSDSTLVTKEINEE